MWYQEYEYNISNYEYRCPKPTATTQILGLNHAIVLTNSKAFNVLIKSLAKKIEEKR